jgi:hypothetical protein
MVDPVNYPAGIGADIIKRDGANSCGYGDDNENQNNTDTRECYGDLSLFMVLDFMGTHSEVPIISRADLVSLFDTSNAGVGQIEYFIYDEEIDRDGVASDLSKVLTDEYSTSYTSVCSSPFDLAVCDANEHQVYARSWYGGSHCYPSGPRKHRGRRYCNPLPYNYYVKASDHGVQMCDAFDCSEPAKGRQCLNSQTYYTSIDIATNPVDWATDCSEANLDSGDQALAEKCFKTCIGGLSLTGGSCEQYGEIVYNSDWLGAIPVGTSACFRALYDVNAGNLNIRVSDELYDEVIVDDNGTPMNGNDDTLGCLNSEDVLCYDAPQTDGEGRPYYPDVSTNNCVGIDCYQQCEVISEVGAEGDRDKSWVRTDIWWRSEEAPDSFNKGWQARYYQGAAYAALNSNVYLESAGGTPINQYFGSAHNSNISNQVVTKVPLDTNEDPNRASILFSNTNLAAANQNLKYLFAKVHNLTWDGTQYTNDADINIDDGTNVNPDAGDDYSPIMYKVDGNDFYNGGAQGITVNNSQSGDISGHQELYSNVKFYYHAHPDHMPITGIHVDWGDGDASGDALGTYQQKYRNNLPECKTDLVLPVNGKLGFGGAPGACHEGYKIFYHTYLYDPAYPCNGTGTKPDISNASCYKPSVTIYDNWGLEYERYYDDWVVIHQN